MRLAFDQAHLTPARITALGPRHLRADPLLAVSGSQWFSFAVRVEGLAPGETGRLDLHWPPQPRVEDLVNPTAEDIDRLTQHDSFATVLADTIHVAEAATDADLVTAHWIRPAVAPLGAEAVAVTLVGTGRPLTLVTQLPYTPAHLEALLAHVSTHAPGAVRALGPTREGRHIPALIFDDRAPADAPVIHLQAYQHLTEFTGPLVLDAFARRLVDTIAGRELRRRFVLDLVPAVDLDGLVHGLAWHRAAQLLPGELRAKNINRDWVDGEYAEVRAVRAHLEARRAAGRRHALIFDLHNGWKNRREAGACYTIFPRDRASEETRAAQRACIDFLTDRTDHCPTGEFYWEHDAPGTFSHSASLLTGCPLSFTVEFSRFQTWDHIARRPAPYDVEWHDRFAGQLVSALLAWSP